MFDFTPIGVEYTLTEPLYIVSAYGRELRLRQSQMLASHQLFALDSDVAKWRRLFPVPFKPLKVDAAAAGAFVMRECIGAQHRADAAKAAASAPAAAQ